MVLSLVLTWSLLLARAAPVLAQAAPVADGVRLVELTAEWTQRGQAGRGFGVLPMPEQANADAAWADGFLKRLHVLKPEQLTHDERRDASVHHQIEVIEQHVHDENERDDREPEKERNQVQAKDVPTQESHGAGAYPMAHDRSDRKRA